MNSEQNAGPTNVETLMGSTDVAAVLQDGSRERVRVLQLPVAKYPELAAALVDEGRQLEIYCGQPTGWAATLAPGSHNELMETAERLNRDFFDAWLRRRMAKVELVRPGAVEKFFAPGAAAGAAGAAGQISPVTRRTPQSLRE